jgi:glycosyltransferase involved in cell wall biosynthesis
MSFKRGVLMLDVAPEGGIKIALAGPVETAAFKSYLTPDQLANSPKGLGGSPVNLMALEFLKRGYELLLVSLDPAVKEEVVLEGKGIKIVFGPFRKKRARDIFTVEREWVRRTLQREQPDFVHAHWTYEYALGAIATDIPHLVTAHDAPFNVLRLNFIPYRIVRTYMAFRALAGTRHLSAVSPHVVQHLRRFLGYRRPIRVIPNGMPDSVFERSKVVGEREDVVFATVLVGWSGNKNGERAIEAFGDYRIQGGRGRLLMFGAGHGPDEEAEAWAKTRGLDEGVGFVGQVPYAQLIDRLAKEVDVLVHPALEEAQPMALIEPMAMGIPVIGGAKAGGVPWTLGDGEAGVLVDVTDARKISFAMQHLAADRLVLREIGARGRELARERFHIGVVVDAYLQAYADILAAEGDDAGLARTG